MRKHLLATVAVVGASALMLGAANAQAPAAAMPTSPMSGSYLVTPDGGGGGANNNLNYQGWYAPGHDAAPTPGTFSVHLNFANWLEVGAGFGDGFEVGPAEGGPAGTEFKANSYNIQEYFRFYPGFDAMATNGLKYGSQVEIRENWSAQGYNSAAPSAGSAYNSSGNASSGFTCTQTLYVRRAFVYLGAASVGILRLGQGDSTIGSFDNGVTTFQNFDTGNWNGDTPQFVPGNLQPAWPYLSQQGADYGNAKAVYLSPQFAGLDFSATWTPNNTQGEGPCANAGIACFELSQSSTSDPRWTNEFQVGARYQATLGAVGVYGYAAYVGSGSINYTGPAVTPAWNGKYHGLSAGNVGVVFTVAGLSVGGNYFGGTYNGANLTDPDGGAPGNAFTVGVQYTNGPITVGGVHQLPGAGRGHADQDLAAVRGYARHRRKLERGTGPVDQAAVHFGAAPSGRLQLGARGEWSAEEHCGRRGDRPRSGDALLGLASSHRLQGRRGNAPPFLFGAPAPAAGSNRAAWPSRANRIKNLPLTHQALNGTAMARRLLCPFLPLIAALALAACGNSAPPPDNPGQYMGAQGPTGPGQNQHALGENGVLFGYTSTSTTPRAAAAAAPGSASMPICGAARSTRWASCRWPRPIRSAG